MNIGEIEVKMAELEKLRDATKKKLSKLLKRKMLESLNNHVLIGSEARKLSEIIDIVFPFHKLNKEYGERELKVSHNNISQIVDEDKEFKFKPFTTSLLWDLAKFPENISQMSSNINLLIDDACDLKVVNF